MSNVSDLDLNLENLFQPAWAQEKTGSNKFAKFTGNEGVNHLVNARKFLFCAR